MRTEETHEKRFEKGRRIRISGTRRSSSMKSKRPVPVREVPMMTVGCTVALCKDSGRQESTVERDTGTPVSRLWTTRCSRSSRERRATRCALVASGSDAGAGERRARLLIRGCARLAAWQPSSHFGGIGSDQNRKQNSKISDAKMRSFVLLGLAVVAAATIEPRTGLSFPEKHKGGSLVNVRLLAQLAPPALPASASEVLTRPSTCPAAGCAVQGTDQSVCGR